MTDAVQQHIEEAKELHKAGRLEDAAMVYSHAFKVDPDNVELLYGWGCVAMERGNAKGAINLFRRLLSVQPDHAKAYWKLGVIYAKQSRYGWAFQFFKQALKYDDKLMPVYSNFALVWLEGYGDAWEAETICQRGLAVNDSYAPLYTILAKALSQQNRSEEALAACDKAAQLDGEKVEALCNKGAVYAARGENEKAASYHRKALAMNPDHIGALYALSGVHKFKKNDPLIKKMETLLPLQGNTSQKASFLHVALADAYHSLGDYDRAFTHMAQFNYILRSGFEYSTAEKQKTFAAIKKFYKAGFEKHALKPRKKDITPLFILGMPRSGTTLTEQILQAHPMVGAAGEQVYLDLEHSYSGLNDWIEQGRDIASVPNQQWCDMRDHYMKKIVRHAPDTSYIIDKMPSNFYYIGAIRLLFPQAKIIHCRRDPMDNCFSVFKHYFLGSFPYSHDLKELGEYYKLYEDMMGFWHKRLPGFIHDVQYEEMVESPEPTMRGILKFCGLEWDDACLDFHKSERVINTASALQVKKPIYKKAVGSWRRYEKHLGVLQRELGD